MSFAALNNSRRRSPLAAFFVATGITTGYISLLTQWLPKLGHFNALAYLLCLGVPILLSAICYASIAHERSTNKLLAYLRVVAAAVLGPVVAWMLYSFVGIIFLGWQF